MSKGTIFCEFCGDKYETSSTYETMVKNNYIRCRECGNCNFIKFIKKLNTYNEPEPTKEEAFQEFMFQDSPEEYDNIRLLTDYDVQQMEIEESLRAEEEESNDSSDCWYD